MTLRIFVSSNDAFTARHRWLAKTTYRGARASVAHGKPTDKSIGLDSDVAGHGPTLFAGLSKHLDLKLVGRREFGSGAVALRYEPRT
jgi:hypothetical protein